MSWEGGLDCARLFRLVLMFISIIYDSSYCSLVFIGTTVLGMSGLGYFPPKLRVFKFVGLGNSHANDYEAGS